MGTNDMCNFHPTSLKDSVAENHDEQEDIIEVPQEKTTVIKEEEDSTRLLQFVAEYSARRDGDIDGEDGASNCIAWNEVKEQGQDGSEMDPNALAPLSPAKSDENCSEAASSSKGKLPGYFLFIRKSACV